MPTFAQGGMAPLGQGGLGGGGFGGGFGGGGRGGAQGGQGGNVGGDGEVSEHILTQGDKTSWPIQGKADEAIIITVTSEVFDPAVEIVDDKDKVIAQNDDVEPGNQMARLITDFPADGEFKIRVSNYRSTAGGKYRIVIKRIKIVRTKVGEAVRFNENEFRFVRVPLAKDKWYGFSHGSPNYGGFEVNGGLELNESLRNFGPSGTLYESKAEGARYFAVNGDQFRFIGPWVVQEVDVKPVPRSGVASANLNSIGLGLYEIELQKGDAFLVENGGAQARGFFHPDPEERAKVAMQGKNFRQAWIFASDKTKTLELLKGAPGAAATTELKPLGQPLTNAQTSGKLALGDVAVYRVDAQAFSVLSLKAKSTLFDTELQVFDSDGQRIGYNDDAEGTNPVIRFSPQTSAPLYVVVSSLGNGGGGDFSLERSSEDAKELGLGTRVEAKGVVAYRVRAKAGVVYQLTSNQFGGTFYDDEGGLTTSQASLGDRMATFARAKKDGWIYIVGQAFEQGWLRVDLAP